jgi:hypothetical protein
LADVTVTQLRPHVTGSNDAILSEAGRTTAVSSVGAHLDQGLRWGTALGHLLVVLPGTVSLGVWTGMTKWDWRLSSHKGHWRFLRPEPPTWRHDDCRVLLRFARD